MQNDTDNQHTNPTDLAYLAGIIDGEGCVSVQRSGKRRKSTNEMGFSPEVTITNNI